MTRRKALLVCCVGIGTADALLANSRSTVARPVRRQPWGLQYESLATSNEDEDINYDSVLSVRLSVDSPLSMLPAEDDPNRMHVPYARNEEWLQQATSDILDPESYPLGELTSEDVESISGLMAAWARRGSSHAALTVEKLLIRVVNDLRAGNPDARVNNRMYTYVSQAKGNFPDEDAGGSPFVVERPLMLGHAVE